MVLDIGEEWVKTYLVVLPGLARVTIEAVDEAEVRRTVRQQSPAWGTSAKVLGVTLMDSGRRVAAGERRPPVVERAR